MLPSHLNPVQSPETNNLQAIRCRVCGKIAMIWVVYENKEYIGLITRNDSRWVHDNWQYTLGAGFRTAENEKRLFALRTQVWRAYKNRVANKVVAI